MNDRHAVPRRAALLLLCVVAALPALSTAQDYPNRPIKLLVPLAAGSTADIASRFAGQELARIVGQPVVIENKPAAGGTVAMGDVARAAPDGYTIAFASQGTLVFNQAIYSRPGEVAVGFYNTPTVISQIKDGKLRALGVTSLARSPLLPGVPTLDEQGIKGYEVNTWFGFIAPAGTPDAVVEKLNNAINRIFASAEAKEKLGPMGFELAPPAAPAVFSKLLADDLARWVPIVKASGAKAD